MPTTLKVAWNFKSAFALHAACGGYLAIVDALQQSIPQADFEAALPQIEEQFSLGWLDGDIVAYLEESVPPVQLDRVPFVRSNEKICWSHPIFSFLNIATFSLS